MTPDHLSIYARPVAPTTFFQKIVQTVRKLWTGKKVVQLTGINKDNEVFTATIGNGRIAKNAKELNALMKDRRLVPIPMKEIHNKAEADQLKPNQIAFVKVNKLAKIGLRMANVKDINKKVDTPDNLKIIQITRAVESSLEAKIYYDTLKDNLINKWSKPVEIDTLHRAKKFIASKAKKLLTPKQRDALIEARTGGSATIRDNPEKRKDWLNAEEFIRTKAKNGEDLTIEDLCKVNMLINGSDNEAIEGGRLRDGPVLLGAFGGLAYVGANDVKPLLEQVVQSIKAGISKGENPVVLATLTYQRMVSIHPFSDANGRTCRLAMDYVLMRAGLPPPSLGQGKA